MKVKDLIKKLDEANPEHEIFVAPLIFLPLVELDTDAGILAGDGGACKIASPFDRYPIIDVSLFTSRERRQKGNQFVILGYETSGPSEFSSTASKEFVN